METTWNQHGTKENQIEPTLNQNRTTSPMGHEFTSNMSSWTSPDTSVCPHFDFSFFLLCVLFFCSCDGLRDANFVQRECFTPSPATYREDPSLKIQKFVSRDEVLLAVVIHIELHFGQFTSSFDVCLMLNRKHFSYS